MVRFFDSESVYNSAYVTSGSQALLHATCMKGNGYLLQSSETLNKQEGPNNCSCRFKMRSHKGFFCHSRDQFTIVNVVNNVTHFS